MAAGSARRQRRPAEADDTSLLDSRMHIERELKFSTTEEHVPSLTELRSALGESRLELAQPQIDRHATGLAVGRKLVGNALKSGER